MPAEVLAVLLLPAPDDVDDSQLRGAACVWCESSPLETETALDLGEQKTPTGETWFPRSCLRCAGAWAHHGLFDHAPTCEQCTDEASRCEIGLTLYRLIRQGRRP
ncbi:hypothetical protein IGX29_20520 [Streptomyces sp. H28]|uniref:hypothetical protein n=1 Tax=Streptomyces sp. H28 TaxID=2775865 RepID=UPI0017854722|nr:hypothetical protein [Streptomyces sp. H28]MBD9734150.1 hypothetical protein [Streptomyces sp. H28]